MSLTQALSSALSGLQVNQAGIALVAANVANADTPGYTRKVMDQVATGTSTTTQVGLPSTTPTLVVAARTTSTAGAQPGTGRTTTRGPTARPGQAAVPRAGSTDGTTPHTGG